MSQAISCQLWLYFAVRTWTNNFLEQFKCYAFWYISSLGASLILPVFQLFTLSLLHQIMSNKWATNEQQISQHVFHYSEQYFYVSFLCQRQKSTEAFPLPSHRLFLVIVNLAPMFFHWFSHSQKTAVSVELGANCRSRQSKPLQVQI